MNVLKISQSQELANIVQQSAPFVCLLHDDCHCNVGHFQNSNCVALAIVGRRVATVRRGKYFVERELSQQYGCPVRLFKNEAKAEQWLKKHLQGASFA